MAHLANSYDALGRSREALQLDEEALTIARATLAPDHPDMLLFRNNLALDYARMHRYDEALRLHQETREISRANLGADHPNTLMSASNVAKALSDLKRHEEALALYKEVFSLLRGKNGPKHPHTLYSMYSIGNELGKLDRYAEALKWHQDALALRKAALGPNHRDTLYSMWGVAVNLFRLNRGREALPIADECLERAAADREADFSGLADRRLDYFAEIGDAEGCVSTAELWEKMRRTDAASLYNAARYRAVAAAMFKKSERTSDAHKRAEKESDQAMEWLRQAIAAGFNDKDRLAKSMEFDSVRDRAEFRELIAKLEQKPH
jgi:tetratricopeptide (TPR) repeat protein